MLVKNNDKKYHWHHFSSEYHKANKKPVSMMSSVFNSENTQLTITLPARQIKCSVSSKMSVNINFSAGKSDI